MAFDVKKVVGDIIDDVRVKAQEMLDSSQVDDRIAEGLRRVADALDGLAGRVDNLDTDPESDPESEGPDEGPAHDHSNEV